jgi:glycosyltransferase involved in cell wall biosynthesis
MEMTSSPLVSVLLPVFQTEHYIGQAIESVLNQTFTDWELVVSDNASTDRTVEVIEGHKDSRIRLIRQPRNRGMVANWAFVIGEGRCDLGCVLGADDAWEPTHLERKVSLLSKHPEALFVHGPIRLIDSNGKFIGLFESGQSQETSSRDFLELNFEENRVNPSAAVFRLARCKELGLGFDLRYSLVMDWHFWMLLALHSETILADSEPTARYRQHPAGGVAQFRDSFNWNYERYLLRSDLLLKYDARWRKLGFDPKRKNRDLLHVIWPYALQRLRRGRMEEFKKLWMLYRRAYSPLEAMMQLPPYLFGPVARTTKTRAEGGKGGA